MNSTEPTKKIAQFFQEMPEVLKTPIQFLEVLDKPIPGFDLLDTTVTWTRTYRVIQSVSKIPRLPKITIPEGLAYKFTRPQKARLFGPTRFTLTGVITRGLKTKFALDGQDIVIDSRTWVIGSIEVGCQARSRGKISLDGTWTAEKVTVDVQFGTHPALISS